MALKTAVKSGKATATATWNTATKVEAGDDLIVPNGFTVEWNSLVVARSLIVETGGGLSGSTEMTLGAATAQAENIALKFATGATITWIAQLSFSSTFTATAQTVSLGGHGLSAKVAFFGKAKYKLLEPLKVTAMLLTEESATLEANGNEIETRYCEILNTGTLIITNTVVKISGNAGGEGWHAEPTATVSASGSTIEFTDKAPSTEKQFNGGGKTYNTVTFPSSTKAESSNTFATLNANGSTPTECKATLATNMMTVTSGEANVFAGAEVTGTAIPIGTTVVKKVSTGVFELSANATEMVAVAETITIICPGVAVTKSTTQTVTVLASNGSAASPARIASTESGKAWTLKLPGNVETQGTVRVKDTTVTGGVLYVPNGVDLGGNTNVKFEHQPATLTQSLGLKGAVVGRKVAIPALASSVGLTGTATGAKSTKGAIVATIGVSSRIAASKGTSGTLTQTTGLSTVLKGNKAVGVAVGNAFGVISRILGELGGSFLIGDTTAYPSSEHHVINWGGGFPGAAQFTATTSGTVTQLSFLAGPEESACTALFLGLFAEGTNAPTGAPLASGESLGKPGVSEWVNIGVAGAKAEVVAGTKYWLSWLPIGGAVNMVTAVSGGGTFLIEDGSGKTKMEAFEWGGTAEVGPASISAFGTEGAIPISEAFAQMLGLVTALTGKKSTGSPIMQRTAVAGAATGTKATSGSFLQQVAFKPSIAGVRRALAGVASSIGAAGVIAGDKASGAASVLQAFGLRGTLAARKAARGELHQQTGAAGMIVARKAADTETANSLGIRGAQAASKSTHGATANTIGVAGSSAGKKGTLAAALANVIGISGTSSGRKSALSALTNTSGVSGAVGGRKAALVSLANRMGYSGAFGGRKGTAGAINTAVGITNRIGWATRRSGSVTGRFGLLGRVVGGIFSKPEAGTVELVDMAHSTVGLSDAASAAVSLTDGARGMVELTDEPATPR